MNDARRMCEEEISAGRPKVSKQKRSSSVVNCVVNCVLIPIGSDRFGIGRRIQSQQVSLFLVEVLHRSVSLFSARLCMHASRIIERHSRDEAAGWVQIISLAAGSPARSAARILPTRYLPCCRHTDRTQRASSTRACCRSFAQVCLRRHRRNIARLLNLRASLMCIGFSAAGGGQGGACC